jgi:uncharacterized protein YbjT (DUF2867 family)
MNPNADKQILVTGATGRQGGAALRHLLQRGFRVRALTRDPEKPAAQALRAKGAEVVKGNLNDPASLGQAMAGVYGVFSVQNIWEKGVGYEGEIKQGRALAQAAQEAKMQHFVQASVSDCDKAAGVKHFESKWEVEKYLDRLGLPRTFLRTVMFMDNLLDPKTGKLLIPLLAGALKPDTPMYWVAVEDIGWLAAEIFEKPRQYLGQHVDLAGDKLTVRQVREVYAEATGVKPPAWKLPAWLTGLMNREFMRQLQWNNQVNWQIRVEDLRAVYPGLTSFREFAGKHLAPQQRGQLTSAS